jgi:hypothetical protein
MVSFKRPLVRIHQGFTSSFPIILQSAATLVITNIMGQQTMAELSYGTKTVEQ